MLNFFLAVFLLTIGLSYLFSENTFPEQNDLADFSLFKSC